MRQGWSRSLSLVVISAVIPLGHASIATAESLPPSVGPATTKAGLAIKTLHPRITSVSPNPLSPNRDHRADRTSFRIHLAAPQHVSFVIRNANGQTIQGPHTPGRLGAGNHTYRWDGTNNHGHVAADGTYTIVVTTSGRSGNATLHGQATASVKVDDSAPAFSGINGNGMTFYPIVDGYGDTFSPKVHVNQGGSLWLEIFSIFGTKVRVIAHPHSGAGTFQFTWNGRDTAGAVAAEGAYQYRFIGQDAAGNRGSSANKVVHLSHQHLVSQSTALVHNGADGSIVTGDTSCTQYSYSLSAFTDGVWLDNVCDDYLSGFQAIIADYAFTVPTAVRYDAIQVQSFGNSINTPEPVVAIIYNFSGSTWNPVGAVEQTQYATNAVSTYGTVAASGRVSAGHVVDVGIGVPNTTSPEDYDIGTVTITVSYEVLV